MKATIDDVPIRKMNRAVERAFRLAHRATRDAQILAYTACGMSQRRIAEVFEMPRSTVFDAIHRLIRV